jgi:hypothetical protein
MAKVMKIAEETAETKAWKQNTQLGFQVGDVKYRVVDFHEEMTARQDEDLIALVGDVLPAVSALDGDNSIAALSMLVDVITSDKALARRVLAILFLPENERVYKRASVEERIEIIGDLPNKMLFPILESIKDFFAFVGKNFPNAFGSFTATLTQKTIAG